MLAWPLLASPSALLACPACFSASNERVLETYYLTAALMTLLPLLIVGVIAGWLYYSSCKLAAEEHAVPDRS